jgi:GH15 family glucan-1,4-alpha-glucosidase
VHEPYYLPYLGFRAAGEWFDSLGHLIAILAGIPDAAQADAILSFIRRHRLSEPPMRAMHPHINPGDPDWRDYYGMLNLPGQYHNGGVWPFIGGFWVAALVKLGLHEEAVAALDRLAALNMEGGFNEWHHGITGEPQGVGDQAWSSGMFLYAIHCVRSERVSLLTP